MTRRDWLRWAGAATAALTVSGCAASTSVTPGPRDLVRAELEHFQRELARNDWARIERFFATSFQSGYGELRNRFEDNARRERMLDVQFLVGRVMERDGLFKAEVRWNKSFLDRTGRPGKRSGLSEFILRPAENGFQILAIRGDALF